MAAMKGARTAVTFPIRLIPPRMTAPTMTIVTRPMISGGMPKVDDIWSETVLAWTAFPVKKAVKASITAKKTAMGFHLEPSPRSM